MGATLLFLSSAATPLQAADAASAKLDKDFTGIVRPFMDKYCVTCHGKEKPKADLDLTPYTTISALANDSERWSLVVEKLQAEEMEENVREQTALALAQMKQNVLKLKPVVDASDKDMQELEERELAMSDLVHKFKKHLLIEKIKMEN